jgi:outer membrane protein
VLHFVLEWGHNIAITHFNLGDFTMIRSLTIAAIIASTGLSAPSFARSVEGTEWDAKERFMIRARIIDVVPDEDSSTNIGGEIDADFGVTPEVDFTYFFTDHIAAELIAATSRHDVKAKGTTLGDIDLGHVWALPPTVTAQYHFNPHGQYRPYVGAGLGYIFWYGDDSGAANNIEYEGGITYALQAGIDIGIDENWAFNADVKKMYHNVDAKVNSGAVRADVDLDPWVFGLGIGYRF